MSDQTLRGSCLCGAVTFELQPPLSALYHCHCSRCRKASGGGHATNLRVEAGQLRWLSGEALITRFKLADGQALRQVVLQPLRRSPAAGTAGVQPGGHSGRLDRCAAAGHPGIPHLLGLAGPLVLRVRFPADPSGRTALEVIRCAGPNTTGGGMMRQNVCAGLALFAAAILGFARLPARADDSSAPAPQYVLPTGTPAYISAAIQDPARPAEQKARDANRKPAELLMMSGIRPGNTVVEFASFGQYFTTFLSDIVGPKGTVYMYDLPYTEKRAGDASRAFVAAHPEFAVPAGGLQHAWSCRRTWMRCSWCCTTMTSSSTRSIPRASMPASSRRSSPAACSWSSITTRRRAPAPPTRQEAASHRSGRDPQGSARRRASSWSRRASCWRTPEDDHTQLVFAPGLRGLTDQTVFVFRKPKG